VLVQVCIVAVVPVYIVVEVLVCIVAVVPVYIVVEVLVCIAQWDLALKVFFVQA
jgi:hypothetical protein